MQDDNYLDDEKFNASGEESRSSAIARRFRSFLPVVVDVETGGLNHQTDALLQIAAVILRMDDSGRLVRGDTHTCHVKPFEGANIDPKSLEINGIDPDHPLRIAYSEQDALGRVFKPIRQEIRDTGCTRAILVGHNATFDLNFLNSAVARAGIRRNPFHPFGSFDTATLAGLAYGQTVLAKALRAAGMGWDGESAHSAIYDAEKTADLFCEIVNQWDKNIGIPG
ncbi:MAG: ribonuclease T [Ectothiorhodospiraceae bacterium]|nr:ribonuclease T [Ectothiorhodospiraceae bacterium]MCH8505011.1 ribonuclease T [Ectothiorhodospiraceae bacterium]